MSSAELDNLVRIGRLKREPLVEEEIAGLLRSAAETYIGGPRTPGPD